jgi:hypothetical protein
MRLTEVAASVAGQHRNKLDELKAKAKELERPDWLWHSLLLSFSTMGNARGKIGLVDNQENYEKVTFAALGKLSSKDRKRRLTETLRVGKVRMSDIKARWLSKNFERISKMGGPASAKQLLMSECGPEAKRKFPRVL